MSQKEGTAVNSTLETASCPFQELTVANRLGGNPPQASSNWLPKICLGAGLSLATLMITYALTRPCVVGTCPEISQAKQLAQPRADSAQSTSQQPLVESIEILQSIPWWSRYRTEANTLHQRYQNRLAELDIILAAHQSAAKATQVDSASGSTASEIQLWQAAIAHLQQIPHTSEFYPQVQAQLQEYRQNLASTNERLSEEAAARKSLKAAQEAALIAKTREQEARSLADWQQVEATWKTAIARLNVPTTTTAHQEAQPLLTEYQTQFVAAGKRKNQEQTASDRYHQATRQAQLAKESESIDQWTTAVSHWNNAVDTIKQVPDQSFYAPQAQPLINLYTQALNEAKAQLQTRSDLAKICAGDPKICRYVITDSKISVHLSSAYLQKIRQTALQAKVQNSYPAPISLLDHIASLEQGLETVSKNTGIPVKVYSSTGSALITYRGKG